tara:strand:- start:721 stop:972 length:252 start_codon:yes stop_codon:yes gene_type:complete
MLSGSADGKGPLGALLAYKGIEGMFWGCNFWNEWRDRAGRLGALEYFEYFSERGYRDNFEGTWYKLSLLSGYSGKENAGCPKR